MIVWVNLRAPRLISARGRSPPLAQGVVTAGTRTREQTKSNLEPYPMVKKPLGHTRWLLFST